MNRLIDRAAHPRDVKKRTATRTAGSYWRTTSWLALLCAMAVTALAEGTTDKTTPVAPSTPSTTTNATTPVSPPIAPAAVSDPSDPQTELMTVVEPKYEMDATSISPMGDDFNPTNGTITFSATDIAIPGNFAIPVELRRWVPSDDSDTGGPAGWKWNIPFIRGNFLDVKDGHSTTGWQWGNGDTWREGKHCTGSADVVIDNAGGLVAPNAYWQGKLLHIPGVTSETFLTTTGSEQVTKSQFKIISSLCTEDANGQQNIVVKGPDGTTYTFNQIKTYYNGKAKLKDPIVRTRLLMITQIKDRFNNTVDYSYDGDGNLSRILASDGREINITNQSGVAITATAHGRTWTYGANSVTLPDGRQWSYSGLSALAFKPNGIGGYNQRIRLGSIPPIVPGCTVAPGSYTATVTSPDGLLTTYTFQDTIHYRANVEPDIYKDLYIPVDEALSRALHCTVARSLISKVVSGSSVGPYTWNYTYSGNTGTYNNSTLNDELTGPFDLAVPSQGGYPAPVSTGSAVNYRSVTISGPNQRSVFYIDRKFQSISEERVVAKDTLNAAGTQLLERSESTFEQGAYVGMHWYMCPCEGVYPPINENQLIHHINQTKEKRIRFVSNIADATFTTAYPSADFDSYGRPKTIVRTGNSGVSRTERLVYDLDDAALGVMGQLKSVSVDVVNGVGGLMVENAYDARKQRLWTRKFGGPKANYEYLPDGNLWKQVDDLNHATTYTDYYRGQPRRIDRANSTFETAAVNDWGLVSSRTDPNGYLWQYGYHPLSLKLETITPPPGWTSTSIAYARATGAAYGLPAGHWSQTVTKGNAKTVTYFDVLWRPLMVRSYDTSNEANTRKVVVKTFDASGQVVFESYPQRDFATVAVSAQGRRMQYDALGRPTRMEADSTQGLQVTTTDYLGSLQTRVTNPRGKITTQGVWALDDPDKAQLATITAPEGVNVTIGRNILGNPTSIRRWGTAKGVSADVTRSYIYDTNQRLCKTLEPEVIATLQSYDAAGNVVWRAPGVNLSSSSCDLASVPAAKKITYTYDAVNQLQTVTYGDLSPGVTRTYWNDGLLKTIDSNSSSWSYTYNSLRKPSTETLSYAGKTYDFGWVYDTAGNLSALTYPTGGPALTYAPNALGEPGQVGSYATNVAFHPNGAISGFNFGNNIAHSQTQTIEGTPQLNADGTVLKDFYTYDANGNVSTIVDQRTSPLDGSSSRTLAYDDLDRLWTASSPGVWNSATYVYDTVDNLRTATVGTRASTLSYGATNRLDSVLTNGSTTTYGYDGNGNISLKGGQTYTFDLGNRLQTTPLGGTYAYDGHGRRIKVLSSDGTTRIQVYSQGGQLLWAEKSSTGTTIAATVTYSCSTGTLVGQQCQSTNIYAATLGTSCNAGDTLNGSTCTHTTTYTATPSYSCPSGGTLSGTTCTKTNTYTATSNYTCPSGGTVSGTTCIKTTNYAATLAYSCPSGGTLGGTTCTQINTYTATSNYSCPSGGTVSGTTCLKTTNYAATLAYSCPSGGTLSGTSCNSTSYVAATVSYSCPNGYTLSGTTCSKTTLVTATATYSCNGAGTANASGLCNGVEVLAYTYYEAYDMCQAQADTYGLSLDSISLVSGKRYKCVFQANTTYSCPGGGTLSGAQCVSTASQTATANYSCSTGTLSGAQCAIPQSYTATSTYSCPSGGTVSGSSCSRNDNYAATLGYTCTSGDSLSGSTCTHTGTYTATAAYSCPSGGTVSGSSCNRNDNYAATLGYTCTSGDSLSGSTCTHTTAYTATSAYSCPSGGALSGSTCTQTNTYTGTANYTCNAGDTRSGTTCTHTTTTAATPNYSCPNGGTVSGNQCVGVTSSTKTAYVYLGGKQIAETTIGGVTQYVHTDALGSPVAHTDSTGAVLNRTKFEPYGYTAAGTKPGTVVAGQSTTGSAIGFTGHVNDPETDLVYMQQRYYDPIAGRFLSVDPVTTDTTSGKSFGRYHYAENNPYKHIDPDGRSAALAACAAGPVGCAIGVTVTVIVAGKAAYDTYRALKNYSGAMNNESAEEPKSEAHSDKPKGDVERDKQRYFDKGQRQRAQDRSKDSDGDATCEYCGVKTTNEPGKKNSAQTDHIIPWIEGGKTTDENANNSCASCNPSKGKKELGTEWIPPKERPLANPSN